MRLTELHSDSPCEPWGMGGLAPAKPLSAPKPLLPAAGMSEPCDPADGTPTATLKAGGALCMHDPSRA